MKDASSAFERSRRRIVVTSTGGMALRILLAGAMSALDAPLDSALAAAGQNMLGLSRTPGGVDKASDLR